MVAFTFVEEGLLYDTVGSRPSRRFLVGNKYELSSRFFVFCGFLFRLDRPLRRDCFGGVSIVDCDLTFSGIVKLGIWKGFYSIFLCSSLDMEC